MEIPRGKGVSKAKLKILPSMGEVWILSGTTHSYLQVSRTKKQALESVINFLNIFNQGLFIVDNFDLVHSMFQLMLSFAELP